MIIGLTGRVGSGKSEITPTLVQYFQAALLDLDQLGHEVLAMATVKSELISVFGQSILLPDGHIDRSALRERVLQNRAAMDQLNAVMHPVMYALVVDKLRRLNGHVLIAGSLIREIGLRDLIDVMLVVDADDADIQNAIGDRFAFARFQRSRSYYCDDADIVLFNTFNAQFIPRTLTQLNDYFRSPLALVDFTARDEDNTV